MPPPGGAFAEERVRAIAAAAGLAATDRGFEKSEAGQAIFAVQPRDGAPEGLSVSLDVARTPDTRRAFQAMSGFAHQLAAALEGRLVDDNGNALDEHAVAAIGAQLEAVRAEFEVRGIAPGSAQALRLFS